MMMMSNYLQEPVSLTGFDTLEEQVSKISNDDVILNDIEELPAI